MPNLQPHTPAVQSVSQHSQRVTVSSHVLVPRSYNRYGYYLRILDNDSLLNIIHYCRPILLNEEGPGDEDMILQEGERHYGLWWYKLAHVCRRWRYLILASSSYLGLRLVCTHSTPVADMLAHSPPLPLVIDYVDEDCRLTAEDDKGILLALQHRDRVRRIRLRRPVPILQELVTAIDEEFPMLEYLYIKPQTEHDTSMTLPKSLQAPHLNRLTLHNFAFPIGSPLLTTAAALVTLSLYSIPSNVLSLSVLLQRLSLIPQLESLKIGFHSPIPDRDVESQRLNVPITTHVTLPNLRRFAFKGTAAYLETLLSRIAAPLLEKLQIDFFNQLAFSIPRLLQFTREAEGLKFRSARIKFSPQGVFMGMYPREGTRADAFKFHMSVICKHLDWQVGCAAQIFNALSPVFSMVEDLTVEYEGHRITPELYQDADRTVWHELLASFGGLKTLRMDDGFVPLLTRSREVDNGDSHMELVPELRELPCTGFKDPGGPFITPFSGCLVTHSSMRQIIHSPSQRFFQFYTIYPVLEDLFKNDLMRFNATTGTKLSEHDLEIEGRQIDLWTLHKAVFLRNGYEAVTTNDEWAIIGVALGFPSFTGRDAGLPARCAPAVVHRLQKLYHDILRHFDQAHITRVVSELIAAKRWVDEQKRKAFTRDTIPESDIQEYRRNLERLDQVLANIEKYIYVAFAALKKGDVVHRMFTMMASSKVQLDELKKPEPRYVLELQTIRGMISEADNMDKGLKIVLGMRAQPPMMPPSGVPSSASQPPPQPPRPPQLIPGPQGPQHLQRQVLAQGSGKPTTLPAPQLFNPSVGPLVRPPTAQSMDASGMTSIGAQIAGPSSSSGVQGPGAMSVPMHPIAIDGVGVVQVRRPSNEELIAAKRWVDEQKRKAFSRDTIPESNIQVYRRNLERLNQVLANIEKYIHVAFAVLKKEDVVHRMFTMMASSKVQLDELKKPKPRCVLELHTIRGMIQEADNMDKGLKTVLNNRAQPQMMPPT